MLNIPVVAQTSVTTNIQLIFATVETILQNALKDLGIHSVRGAMVERCESPSSLATGKSQF
jgi:hypothetical protein